MKLNKPTPKQCPHCQNPLTPKNTATILYTCTATQLHEHQLCTPCLKHTTIPHHCECGTPIIDWATHTPHQTQTSW